MNTQPELFAVDGAVLPITKERYVDACRKRWSGIHLNDAVGNWRTWRKWHEALEKALPRYVGGEAPTLTEFIWKLHGKVQPDKASLYPFLDFEEHFQTVFVRRGLLIYCGMILRQQEERKP